MKLTDQVFLVGSGNYGISHDLDSNVYVIDCGGELVMIDAGGGCDVDLLIRNMEHHGLEPGRLKKVLLTHSHSDHAAGAHELQERLHAEICIGTEEADIVESGTEADLGLDLAKEVGFYPLDYRFKHCRVSIRLKHGDEIRCGDHTFRTIHTPGHSRGSYSYLVALEKGLALFSGDTVFAEGKLFYTNMEGSDLSDYRRTIQRLAGLQIDMLFPGHKVFCLTHGQRAIDIAAENLKKLRLPPNFE